MRRLCGFCAGSVLTSKLTGRGIYGQALGYRPRRFVRRDGQTPSSGSSGAHGRFEVFLPLGMGENGGAGRGWGMWVSLTTTPSAQAGRSRAGEPILFIDRRSD